MQPGGSFPGLDVIVRLPNVFVPVMDVFVCLIDAIDCPIVVVVPVVDVIVPDVNVVGRVVVVIVPDVDVIGPGIDDVLERYNVVWTRYEHLNEGYVSNGGTHDYENGTVDVVNVRCDHVCAGSEYVSCRSDHAGVAEGQV